MDKLDTGSEEFFYKVMIVDNYKIIDNYEVLKDMDFPHKDELGGCVVKLRNGGAVYVNILREIPPEGYEDRVFEVCQFLEDKFGGYITGAILCAPHIEIHDFKEVNTTNILVNHSSLRLTDGERALKILMDRLESDGEFNEDCCKAAMFLPLYSYDDRELFKSKHQEFLELASKKGIKIFDINKIKS